MLTGRKLRQIICIVYLLYHIISKIATGAERISCEIIFSANSPLISYFFRNFKGIFHVIIEYLENVRMGLFDADGGEVHVGEAMGGVTFYA